MSPISRRPIQFPIFSTLYSLDILVQSNRRNLLRQSLPTLFHHLRCPTGTDAIDPATLGAVLPKWKRFTLNRTILGVLRLARPALADLFMNAAS